MFARNTSKYIIYTVPYKQEYKGSSHWTDCDEVIPGFMQFQINPLLSANPSPTLRLLFVHVTSTSHPLNQSKPLVNLL
jgi:hypothetical protein